MITPNGVTVMPKNACMKVRGRVTADRDHGQPGKGKDGRVRTPRSHGLAFGGKEGGST
jgi:hypothetical protein